jgi:dTDP-4-dehydrorhamnose reductase
MRILLTGKNGQVGWELQRTLSTLGEVIALGQADMDLANPDAIRKICGEVKPNLIVNPAAYTAVDKAETEPALALAINGTAPGILAQEAQRLGAALIHYSTDYVFDGSKNTPYTEQDIPNPQNIYGSSKLAGERAIQAVDVPHLILRTAWVYGRRGKNFLLTMQRLASERPLLKVVDDQVGAPTWCRLLAEATAQIVAQGLDRGRDNATDYAGAAVATGILPSATLARPCAASVTGYIRQHSGVYHMSCAGQTSWHGFANAILEGATTQLQPIPSNDYPTPAARPAYSVLSNEQLAQTFGITFPDWRAALEMVLAEN